MKSCIVQTAASWLQLFHFVSLSFHVWVIRVRLCGYFGFREKVNDILRLNNWATENVDGVQREQAEWMGRMSPSGSEVEMSHKPISRTVRFSFKNRITCTACYVCRLGRETRKFRFTHCQTCIWYFSTSSHLMLLCVCIAATRTYINPMDTATALSRITLYLCTSKSIVRRWKAYNRVLIWIVKFGSKKWSQTNHNQKLMCARFNNVVWSTHVCMSSTAPLSIFAADKLCQADNGWAIQTQQRTTYYEWQHWHFPGTGSWFMNTNDDL